MWSGDGLFATDPRCPSSLAGDEDLGPPRVRINGELFAVAPLEVSQLERGHVEGLGPTGMLTSVRSSTGFRLRHTLGTCSSPSVSQTARSRTSRGSPASSRSSGAPAQCHRAVSKDGAGRRTVVISRGRRASSTLPRVNRRREVFRQVCFHGCGIGKQTRKRPEDRLAVRQLAPRGLKPSCDLPHSRSRRIGHTVAAGPEDLHGACPLRGNAG